MGVRSGRDGRAPTPGPGKAKAIWLVVVTTAACFPAVSAAAQATDGDATVLREVEVVATTPLPGPYVDADKLPATVDTLSSEDFTRAGSLAVTDALEQRVAGLSTSDTQGNGFTKDVNFRGFEASPLQGTPQGLAVYMNGVRLNEAFGDTVNWDLIPETAISRAELFTSNPAFGLNALGGAVSLQMKTGFDAPGGHASLEGGSFGRVYGSAEYGASSGPWALYLAADGGREDGWRLHSPSTLARAYADFGWKGERSEVHLIAAGEVNDVGVVGPTPVDLLNADRSAVYTYPQTTANHAALFALNDRFTATDAWSIQTSVYVREFNQHHTDGNDADLTGCGGGPSNPLFGTVCLEDDSFPDEIRPPAAAFQLLGPDDRPIACPPLSAGQTAPCGGIPYGTIDRTRTASTTWGGSVQASSSGAVLGHANVFAAGASLDHSGVRFSANSTLGMIFPDLSVGPDPAIPGSGEVIHTAGAIAYSPVELRTGVANYGVYLTDTLDLTERLFATVSGRLNIARIGMTDLTGASPDLNGQHHFDRLNPAAGLAYKASDALTLYGGYSEANRAPTPLELACSDPLRPCLLENALVADPPLRQVVAHTWEAGLRGSPPVPGAQFDWRLGLFQTDNDDDIVALASAIQGRGSYANVPRTRRRGLEASVQYRSAHWLAYANYSYVQATYQFSGALASPNSPFADAAGDEQIAPGDRIGGVPAQRLKLGADVMPTAALTLGTDVIAVGSQNLVGDEANQDARLPGYWIANLHASWRFNRRLELFARIENLLNRDYATYGTYFETDGVENVSPSPLPADPNPRTLTPAPPRAFLIGLRASW